ncbi:FecR domain-containing protein [Achromobacter pestifer]|uniref:FecR domain-containing protein n=1 Tax=Achromobacter pestifer TaxID=1353889 RepID=A0A7D4I0E9_9BURK|nr:FecR domain-containing protein [Achromobacter pestifer]QKH36318.1 FecR domain-containing protein [Achromobacter pestifer]
MPAAPGIPAIPQGLNRSIDPAIVQRAAEWMARLWSEDANPVDQTDCARWRAQHADHELAWQRLLAFEDKLGSVSPQAASHALRKRPAGTSRRRAISLLGLGAAVAGVGYVLRGTDSWQAAMADYRSGTGEIRTLTLPDGSSVTLSTATAIDLRFSEEERLVVLRAGEILIATAPDPAAMARPFRVRSRHGSIQALGTRFSVRDDADTSRVAVFEGAVEIRPLGAPDQAVLLQAGQGSRFSAAGAAAPSPAAESAAAWSRGMLVADAMRLDEFLAELARYRPGLLRCDPEVAGLLVSGVFSVRDTDRALDNLTRALPVAVTYRTRYWVTVQAAQ